MSDAPEPEISEDAAALVTFLRVKRVTVRVLPDALLIVSDGGATGWRVTLTETVDR